MLTDQQVETFIYQFRTAIEQLQTQQTTQNATLNQLQTSVNSLVSASNNMSNNASQNDTYLSGNTIIHKLATIFQAVTTFAENVLVKGVLSLTNALTVSNGGTGAATLTGVLVGNGTSPVTTEAGVTNAITLNTGSGTISLNVTTATLVSAPTNVVTAVSLSGITSALTSASISSNAFTQGVKTT